MASNSSSVACGAGVAWIAPLFLDLRRAGETLRESEERFRLLVQTAPSVSYQVLMNDGSLKRIESAGDLPSRDRYQELREPIVEMQIIIPAECVGTIMKLTSQRRGVYRKTEYLSPQPSLDLRLSV